MLAPHASSSLSPVSGRFFASIPAFTGGEAVRRKSFGRKTIASLAIAVLFLAMGCGSSEREPISERPSEALTPKEITTEVGASADSTGSGSSSSIGSTANRRILVEVRGFKTDEGQCRMAIYLGKKGFNQPDQAVGRLAAAIVVGDDQTLRVQWSIDLEELLREVDVRESSTSGKSLLDAKGTGEQTSKVASELSFAIGAHHDRNTNEKLDKNALGMPIEPYGFSNNPKRGFGPPSYEEVAVKVGGENELGSEPIRVVIDVR